MKIYGKIFLGSFKIDYRLLLSFKLWKKCFKTNPAQYVAQVFNEDTKFIDKRRRNISPTFPCDYPVHWCGRIRCIGNKADEFKTVVGLLDLFPFRAVSRHPSTFSCVIVIRSQVILKRLNMHYEKPQPNHFQPFSLNILTQKSKAYGMARVDNLLFSVYYGTTGGYENS